MSLLDHLVNSSYSYGLKYKVDFRDRVNNLISLRISKKDYTGSVQGVILTQNKIVIKKNFLDEDFFLPIAGTQIEITLTSNLLSTYIEFASGSNIDFYVEVFKNQKLYAFGYLIPDTYSEDGWFAPFVTKISATDHLGFLKDFQFAYPNPEVNEWTWKETQITGVEKASDIITFILNKCYLRESLVWWDLIPLIPKNALYVDWGCLQNIYFECNEFHKMTCEEVLKSILDKFNARIVQYSNGYLIQSPDERTYNKGIEYYWNGTINDTNVDFYNVYKVGGSKSEDIDARITGRTTTSIQKAVRKLTVGYTKEEKQENNFTAQHLPSYPELEWFYMEEDNEKPCFIASPQFFIRMVTPIYTQSAGVARKCTFSFSLYSYSTYRQYVYLNSIGPPEPFTLEYIVSMTYGTGANKRAVYDFFYIGYGNTYTDEFGMIYTSNELGYVEVPIRFKTSTTSYDEWSSQSFDFQSSAWGIWQLDYTDVEFQVTFYRYYNTDTNENYTIHPDIPEVTYLSHLYTIVRDISIKFEIDKYSKSVIKIDKICNQYNNTDIEIEKTFVPNYRTDHSGSVEFFYLYKNVFLSKNSSNEYYLLEDTGFNKTDGNSLPSFVDYIASKYNWYYGKNKMKNTISIAGIENLHDITPFTWFILREFGDTPCYVLSYTYDLFNYIIDVEILFDMFQWILAEGIWNDDGIWLDSQFWNDGAADAITPFYEKILNS